jgi:hypothetical protein
MYILTLNFPNQVSIIWFYLGFLKTWLHWNKDISIDDFIIDIIVRAAFTFVNLEYHSFIEINYSKIIHYCFFLIVQEIKTYLYVMVGLPLSNALHIVYILLRMDTLSARWHYARRACIEKGCIEKGHPFWWSSPFW